MQNWIDVAAVSDFPAGAVRTVEARGLEIAVFNVDGYYYAIADCCTHEAERLSGGSIEGLDVVCPLHQARFSLVTGRALSPPAYEPVMTYPVRVDGGMVQVGDQSA